MINHTDLRVEAFVFQPTGRTQFRCTGCRCTVSQAHVAGSDECEENRVERLVSQAS